MLFYFYWWTKVEKMFSLSLTIMGRLLAHMGYLLSLNSVGVRLVCCLKKRVK